MITMESLKFIKGRAIVKDDRKVIAKIYHRPTFYPLHNINSGYSQPYSIEMNIGQRECKDLEECIFFIKKYTPKPLANY